MIVMTFVHRVTSQSTKFAENGMENANQKNSFVNMMTSLIREGLNEFFLKQIKTSNF